MSLFRVSLPDAQAQNILVVQFRVRQVEVTGLVEVFQQALVEFISSGVAEADQIQRCWGDDLETFIGGDPGGEFLSESDVPPDMIAQPLHTIVADDEPEFEGTEAPTQGDMPITIIDHGAGLGGLVAQVFRQHAEGLNQICTIRDVKTIAVEVGEHPFVRVETVAVSQFESILYVAELGAEGGGASHSGVDVQPETLITADLANLWERVEGIGGSGAYCRAYECGSQTCLAVLLDLTIKCSGLHGVISIDLDQPEILFSQPGDLDRFFDGGMRLSGGVGYQVSTETALVAVEVGSTLARSQQGA